MNNVIDVSELFKSFKDDNEKQAFLEAQFEATLSLQNKLKQLEEENIHLKQLLISNAPELNIPLPIIITPEEYLIDKQIEILENRGRTAADPELTLEEIKKLDLLLKNKKIIKDSKEVVIKAKPSKGKLSNKELALIASTKKDISNE